MTNFIQVNMNVFFQIGGEIFASTPDLQLILLELLTITEA